MMPAQSKQTPAKNMEKTNTADEGWTGIAQPGRVLHVAGELEK
jgi:hypothetical protein